MIGADPASTVRSACSLGAALSYAAELFERHHPPALWATVTGETILPWCDVAARCPSEWLEWRPVVPLAGVAEAMAADLAYVDPESPVPIDGEDRYHAMRPYLMHAVDEGGFILLCGKWSASPRRAWGLVKRALWDSGRFFGRTSTFLRAVEASLEGPPVAALIISDVREVPRGKEIEAADAVRDHIFKSISAMKSTAEPSTPPHGIAAPPLVGGPANAAIGKRLSAAARGATRFCDQCADRGVSDSQALLLDWALRRRTFLGLVEETPGLLPWGSGKRALERMQDQVESSTALVEDYLAQDLPPISPFAAEWARISGADRALAEAFRRSPK